jgi:hypothetical protein
MHLKLKTTISETVYKNIKKKYQSAIQNAKSQYFNSLVSESEGDSKKLYSTVSKILGRDKDNPLPNSDSDESLANEFNDFFINKIQTIRDELDNTTIEAPLTNEIENKENITEMNQFKSLTSDEVTKLISCSKSTTCATDILPTHKLKQYLPHLISVITCIINTSLASGVFPQSWKCAVVKPLLKKQNLPLEFKNYRPISNLIFLSKILEKAALQQIVNFIESNCLLPAYQSAYRKYHGVETAMIHMYSNLLKAADDKLVSIVVMIDLSAAFDTVDIEIIMNILEHNFHISGTPLNWFKTYLCDRNMKVSINDKFSSPVNLKFGVPQGSCAGPVIFTLYIAALKQIVEKYSPTLYGYADDHKLALTFHAGNTNSETKTKFEIEDCLRSVGTWMTENKLKMNNSKTEIIVYGTKQQVTKVKLSNITVNGAVVNCVNSVRDLGVWMENSLGFNLHIQKKSKIANHQLHNLRNIRSYLTPKSTEILVHGLVHSHIDFCNGLFPELPSYQLDKFQKIQNRAARLVFNSKYDAPASPLLEQLHWLPVKARIIFKILCLVFKCLNGNAPQYLKSLLEIDRPRYNTRNTQGIILKLPKTRIKLTERSFHVAGPKYWNSLPLQIRMLDNEGQFRKSVKTHLFRQFY